MEEQQVKTIVAPRIILKKMSKGYNWDIATSEGETITEIIEIVDKANKLMIGKYGSKR